MEAAYWVLGRGEGAKREWIAYIDDGGAQLTHMFFEAMEFDSIEDARRHNALLTMGYGIVGFEPAAMSAPETSWGDEESE